MHHCSVVHPCSLIERGDELTQVAQSPTDKRKVPPKAAALKSRMFVISCKRRLNQKAQLWSVVIMVEKQELIDALNRALSLELQAIVQYLHHSYEIMGPFRSALAGELSGFSKAEMKHMEYLSKKIVALGGDPTTQPAPIKTSSNAMEMLQQDLDGEKTAIDHYKNVIGMAEEVGDVDLKKTLEDITSVEIGHKEDLEKLMKQPNM